MKEVKHRIEANLSAWQVRRIEAWWVHARAKKPVVFTENDARLLRKLLKATKQEEAYGKTD